MHPPDVCGTRVNTNRGQARSGTLFDRKTVLARL